MTQRLRAVSVAIVVTLVAQGCGRAHHDATAATIQVGPAGGHFVTALAQIDVPDGAVAKLTKLHVAASKDDPLEKFPADLRSFVDTPAAPLRIDLSGKQPLKPIVVTLNPPVGADPLRAVLLSSHDDTPTAFATSRTDAGSVQATIDRLSIFRLAFLRVDAMTSAVKDAVTQLGEAVGAAGKAPDCANKPLTLASGLLINVAGPTSPLSLCISSDQRGLQVAVQSADAIPWRVRISNGTYDGAIDTSLQNASLQAFYDQVVADRRFSEGLIAPHAKGTWHAPANGAPLTVQASISVGMWLATAVMFSTVYLLEVFGGTAARVASGLTGVVKSVVDAGGALDCVASTAAAVPEGAIPSTAQIGALLKAGIDCAGPVAKQLGAEVGGVGALILSALGTGAAVVISGFEAAVREITGPILTWHVGAGDVTSHVTPVLGRPWAPDQTGYGTTAPATVHNGGDPTGLVRDIRWDDWGAPQTTGHGTSVYVAPNQYVADGTVEPATVVAFDLGDCKGVLAYRAVEWFFPQHGETFDPGQYINACTGDYVGH